ncbi:hypothetical protein CFN78_08050 [Amycolatopsis antarctica]|uniref:Uncharacterized protein n=1 Tax=Amycolatopsis antarctica TaxID=1854586 RepID=A0A263D4R4_9PSEU|nr:gephyrin-like molybdotransferase receptor GlpR [Amycolatopsis antarctica]OZM73494.1 hypothetical protein CFN78_08050 [Amycolatopsis antarctica]
MPSSLIIVALAAAWLVVLVPMIARKRQEIARTTDSALAARVVRVGGARDEGPEEFAMSDKAQPAATAHSSRDVPLRDEDTDRDDAVEIDELDEDVDDELDADRDEQEGRFDDEVRRAPERVGAQGSGSARRYRPGRGGYDPEAAEIAARAKYAFRQRVVLGLIVTAVVTAALAGFLWPVVWWVHGAVDVALVAYLGYLRRQVRIEDEIRTRRSSRLSGSRRVRHEAAPTDDLDGDLDRYDDRQGADEEVEEQPQRRPGRPPLVPQRPHRNGVVLDVEDEDPAFHELDEPGQLPYRRAVGE